VARKLLRVNLSDLAAMGADPWAYVLMTAWPRDIEESWIAGFAEGLQKDQDEFAIALAGGDTVASDGLLTLSLTALGQVPAGQALKRSAAAAGDVVLVSGTIGDAGAGLLVAKGDAGGALADEDKAYLIGRYRLPQPRLGLGRALRRLAGAVIDISDGLLADLGHIAEASRAAFRGGGALPGTPGGGDLGRRL
jgi:thiamine-monophosphate kinase